MLLPQLISSSKSMPKSVVYSLAAPRSALILGFVLAIFCLRSTAAQTQEPAVDDVVRTDIRLAFFPISVRNKHGQAVNGLTQNDLTLKDADNVTDGLYLYHGADRVSLVFALDQSGSVREIVNQQREAALSLFAEFGEKSQVAVIHFAETPKLAVEFGRGLDATRHAFNSSSAANQHTAIFEAAAAANDLFKTLPRIRSERRLIILISDGLDTASRVKPAAVIEAALKNQVTFYVIHVPLFTPSDGRLKVRKPSRGFRELAEKTGGKYFLVGDTDSPLGSQPNIDLSPVFKAIEEDLKSQYILGFYQRETSNDGRMHRLVIGFPSGIEYQIGGFGYSQTHEVFIGTEKKR